MKLGYSASSAAKFRKSAKTKTTTGSNKICPQARRSRPTQLWVNWDFIAKQGHLGVIRPNTNKQKLWRPWQVSGVRVQTAESENQPRRTTDPHDAPHTQRSAIQSTRAEIIKTLRKQDDGRVPTKLLQTGLHRKAGWFRDKSANFATIWKTRMRWGHHFLSANNVTAEVYMITPRDHGSSAGGFLWVHFPA